MSKIEFVTALVLLGAVVVVSVLSIKPDVVERHSAYRDPQFVYAKGITHEHLVSPCSPGSACNIVHQRFWFSTVVVRLCRCQDKSECPWEWLERDNHTMFINPRAQLKFCRAVKIELPKCRESASALLSELEVNDDLERMSVHSNCYCPKLHYFRLEDTGNTYIGNITTITKQSFSCQQLGNCKTGQFCGHITGDLYQTYYTCRCPRHHMCLMKSRSMSDVQEALYQGRAYRGICTPRYGDPVT